ncbi:MAG TPA: hypothetical protein VHC22_19760 [Pirellulales bacterium]|nr:hypothetical protein [Pirellulales bacterium]
MLQSTPDAVEQPIKAETLAAMSGQLLGGEPRDAKDFAAVAMLLTGLEQDMSAFHRVELGETEPAVVYSPTPAPRVPRAE